jgi:hypothetical protein
MKQNLKWILATVFVGIGMLALVLNAFAQEKEKRLRVGYSAICVDVQDREPVGVDTTFNSDVGFLFCFTRIEGAADSTSVTHAWYYGDSKMAEITLPVKSARWRTYSKKQILPQHTGKWNVVVLSEAGDPLAQMSFFIKPAQTE